MIEPVQGIFAVGHPVTSGGTAAISIRLVHKPSSTNATAKTPLDGARAASTAATTTW